MKKKDKSTEEAILQVARKAFTQKGLSGARMQDIADEAGINKALVHYYFETKEKLFALIFEQEFGKFFSNLALVISSEIPLFEKIEQMVKLDIERLSQFPDLPLFVLNEVSHNPARMVKRLKQMGVKDMLGSFQKQIDGEIKNGTIKSIRAEQLLINIQSLSIFPFIAKPMIKNVFQINEKDFQEMIEVRKKEVSLFIIDALKINDKI
ncbi:MAG: TetR/AcrR family transcriptional regulator [Ferruginibacter sp.]|nr:TetR/AcrR family transcriptional regulator [Ferruginibacter sp.]